MAAGEEEEGVCNILRARRGGLSVTHSALSSPRGGGLIIPRAVTRKLRHKEVKGHAQDHTDRRWPDRYQSPALRGAGVHGVRMSSRGMSEGKTWRQEVASTLTSTKLEGPSRPCARPTVIHFPDKSALRVKNANTLL